MSARPHSRFHRSLAALSLAAYAAFGFGGYGLHGLLPCVDGDCSGHEAAPHCGCCNHDQFAAPADDQVVAFRTARQGHDAGACALCTLLAKINVGYAATQADDVHAERTFAMAAPCELRRPADLVLAASARGPPTA